MAKHSGTCNCGTGMATTTVAVTIRIMTEHRDEVRNIAVCQRCADQWS